MRRVAALLLFLAVALFGGGALASHLNGAGGRPLPWPSSPEIDPPDRFLALRATGSEGRESYRPFGKAVRIFGSAPANDNNTGFTGHLEDDASGLAYMQARYYDPFVGRFYSTDPIGYQDQLNLYAYVANDPVNTTDPTGECPWCVFGAVVGGGIQAFAEVNKGSFSNGALSKQGLQALGRIAISAGAGALGGGVATAAAKISGAGAAAVAARIGANAAGGAAIGATQNTANAAVEGRLPTSGEVASGAAMGAAFSGGGAALGEAVDAAGKALASSATAGQSAAQMSDAMVNGAQAPPGMHVQGLYPAASQHPASVGGAVLGNAASGVVANSGPLVGGGSPAGCTAGSSQEKC